MATAEVGAPRLNSAEPAADHYLDITQLVCPMTFVRTKLLVERMRVGETAEVRLNAGEPLRNVPRSLREHGHEVLGIEPESGGETAGVYRLRLRKR
ncbi:MAG: sulfurtransferase TusA family protein [Alphaproteobacteria bacterium]|nr:sulfurtransferase TusA family protein [Alphaproteobacteria bacterium]